MFFATPNEFCRYKLVAKMLKTIPLDRNRSCLEIGCGNGSFISYASALGLRVMGIDISEKSILHARNKNPSSVILKKNLFDIEDEYDIIFCFEVLEHIENDYDAIKKISQLIKKNGFFLCSVPAHPDLYYNVLDKYYGHFRRYKKNKLITLLKANNLKTVYFWSYGFKLASVMANMLFSYRGREEIKFGSIGDNLYQVKYPLYWEKIINPILSLGYPLFHLYDLLFLKYDFGHSYLVLCQKE